MLTEEALDPLGRRLDRDGPDDPGVGEALHEGSHPLPDLIAEVAQISLLVDPQRRDQEVRFQAFGAVDAI
jgi:hypothetical protein